MWLTLGFIVAGLYGGLIIYKEKKEKAELQRELAISVAIHAKKIIVHDRAIQAAKDHQEEKYKQIIQRLESDVEDNNFDDFYD